MGSNLNQVFISDSLAALSGTTFNDSGAASDDVGIWQPFLSTPAYLATVAYATQVDITDEVQPSTPAATDEVTDVISTVTNPLWLIGDFQIVQRPVNGNWIASPIIRPSQVKRITYTDHTAWAGHKATVDDADLDVGDSADNDEYQYKFIIRAVPVNQSAFYNNGKSGLYSNVFPLGAFNTTNHKAINMNVVIPNHADATAAANNTAVSDALAAHPLLKDLVAYNGSGAGQVFTSLHPGLIFDLIVTNSTQSLDSKVCTPTGEVKGSGNDWQVTDDEIRCRSRYGNFNRMYFPQDVDKFANVNSAYDKITIEYAHNWPDSTGIAPAGSINTATIYYTNAGTDPAATASEFATLFGYTQGTDAEFIW